MKPSMEELLMEYRRTEAALRLRRDQAWHALREQAKPKGDAVRRVAVLGEMLADVRITILEIEDYLDKAGTKEEDILYGIVYAGRKSPGRPYASTNAAEPVRSMGRTGWHGKV